MDFVFEPDLFRALEGDSDFKGIWKKDIFKNELPIVVELGCGKGEYSTGLAKLLPNRNYIGVDIKGARIWEGANIVRENNLKNVAFLRTKVDFIDAFFEENEIDEIWLTFSDPQPQKPNKRLTSKIFLDKYKKFLKPGGIINLKTDSDLLFESTLDVIKALNLELVYSSWNIYDDMLKDFNTEEQEVLKISTVYEVMFGEKGFDIKYCQFKIN